MQIAQIWRSEEDTPNDLLPSNNKAGTISPIKGPAMYHGQGSLNHEGMFIVCFIKYTIKLQEKFFQDYINSHDQNEPSESFFQRVSWNFIGKTATNENTGYSQDGKDDQEIPVVVELLKAEKKTKKRINGNDQ